MNKMQFPKGFYWGAATSSYQVEGGINNNDWSEAGRLGKVPLAGNATDHYNRFKTDFDLTQSLCHNSHRISIEWSRIEPEEGKFDANEIKHYREVLRAMHDRGIEPFVTLWHFTLPIWFAKKGGFCNRKAPRIFARYCAFVVRELHDLCHYFSTMNEPMVYASHSYARGDWPPFRKSWPKTLRVINNLAKAHRTAYDAIKKINSTIDVSVVKHNILYTADWNPFNKIAARMSNSFWNHRFLRKITDSFDSIGLNFYHHAQFGRKKSFPKSDFGWDLDPSALREVLIGLSRYKVPVYVTEAGLSDSVDKYRADYIRGLVKATHEAITAGVDVRGFMYWSLLDNFEWAAGYSQKFGLFFVEPSTKERIARPSALIYKKICADNALTIE